MNGLMKSPEAPKLAIDMCRSVHLHFDENEDGDLHEIFAFMYTIRSAYKMLPRHAREAQWITKDLAAIVDRSGLEVAHNIFDMYTPKWAGYSTMRWKLICILELSQKRETWYLL